MNPARSASGRAAALCLALTAVPLFASAQQAEKPAVVPIVKPNPPVRPQPAPSRRPYHRPNATYPVVIDGSMMNRYLATPTPAPHHSAKPRTNGQDVFETHSSDDAK